MTNAPANAHVKPAGAGVISLIGVAMVSIAWGAGVRPLSAGENSVPYARIIPAQYAMGPGQSSMGPKAPPHRLTAAIQPSPNTAQFTAPVKPQAQMTAESLTRLGEAMKRLTPGQRKHIAKELQRLPPEARRQVADELARQLSGKSAPPPLVRRAR